jgi:serine/threonine-protein kinase
MNQVALPSLSSLPVEEALRVERLCTQFEAAWQQRPRIEDYRPEVPEAVWPVLLRELLPVELAYRRQPGEQPTLEEYRARLSPLDSASDSILTALLGAAERPSSAAQTLPYVPAAGEPHETGGEPRCSPQGVVPNEVTPRFDGYEKVQKIGGGAQGVVYKVWNSALRRWEALKVIAEQATARDRQRFRFEGEAAAALDHPNIVTIYRVGEVGGLPFLAMKWVEGGTLALALRGDLHKVVGLLVKAARAVQHAHQRGLLHRDLKPGNILLDEQGEPHIADFGLARRLDAQTTVAGEVEGTLAYMAPEQALGERSLTIAVDVYGLGAILFEALTGRPPFVGKTVRAILRQVQEQAPPQPSSLKPGIDPDLEAVCLKCLERDPSARYASAEALARDLDSWLRGEGVSVRPPGMLNWLRQIWRTTPPRTTYLWQFQVWVGLVTLATHGASFALILLDGRAWWLWLILVVRVGGLAEVIHRYRTFPLRLPGPRMRHSLIASMGLTLAEVSLALAYVPFSISAPARAAMGFYPPLAVVCGLAYLIVGSTTWGRLLAVGLVLIALAPVLAEWPEGAPLLFGAVAGAAALWWAYCTRKYFWLQPVDSVSGRA